LPSNESLPTNENSNEGPGTDTSQENFFVEYRLQRERARSEQIAIYREMINNPNITEEARNKTQEKMMDLTEKMEKEVEIESLIRARGYEDALAYLHENSVDVIVRSSGLNEEDVARIGDIIVKTTGLGFDDVTIIEKKVPVQN